MTTHADPDPVFIVEETPLPREFTESVQEFIDRASRADTTGVFLSPLTAPVVAQLVRHGGERHSAPLTQDEWLNYYGCLQRSSSGQAAERLSPAETVRAAAAHTTAGVVPVAIANIHYQSVTGPVADEIRQAAQASRAARLPAGTSDAVRGHRAFLVSALLPRRWDVFTALPPVHDGLQVRFLLTEQLYLSNDPHPADSAEIDCADGLGFRPARLDEAVEAGYADAGDKQVRLRLSCGGQLLEGSFTLTVADPPAVPAPDDQFLFTATIPYENGLASGGAYIWYGTEQAVKHTRLVRPVLVVDGFPGHDYIYLWNEILDKQGFLARLLRLGFDLVLVAWLPVGDGTTYVQRNAFAVVECIKQLQIRRTGSAKLIVGGGSMGGIIARYALAYMERQSIPHETSLFFTFDSPHQGAEIPPADLFQIAGLATKYNSDDALESFRQLRTPAARQLLYYAMPDVDAGSYPVHDLWRQEFAQNLDQIGYPQKCRKIALASGCGDGKKIFPDYAKTLDWDATLLLSGQDWMLPTSGSTERIQIGVFEYWNRYWLTVAGLINYDNAPGGQRDTNGELERKIAKQPCVAIYTHAYDVHCFIPTVSALDVKGGMSNPYQLVPQQGADTPFDNYQVSGTNELHVTMTEQAATFLLDEFLGQLNVALDKPNTATSSADGFGPALGNDGLVTTGWQPADGDTQPAWTVDLGQGYQLIEIRLTTRQDLDQPATRRNFQIWASNDPSMNDHVVLGGQGSDVLPFRAVWKLTVTDQASYRYIRATKTAAEGFFVAELAVAITDPATLPLQMVMPGADLLPYVTASGDGFNWELALGPVIGRPLGAAPDLATFAGNLVMTYPATDGTVYIYTSADGINWAQGASLDQAIGPARMTTMNGQLFIGLLRGDGFYVVSTEDLQQWYSYRVRGEYVPTAGSAPTITALNGILYLGVRSVSDNVFILASADQARTWTVTGTFKNILVVDSPEVCGFAGDLYIACRDTTYHEASVWRTSDQGETATCVSIGWPADTWIASGTPTLVVMNDTLFLGFPGSNNYEYVLVYDGDKGWTIAANQAGGRQIGLPAALASFAP